MSNSSRSPGATPERPSRREWLTVAGLSVGIVVVLAALARPGQGLGGDEADYVWRALDFRAATAPIGDRWGDYRAPGLPFLMSLVPGGSTWAMRLVPILCCGLGIVVTWLLARALFGRRVALITAGLLALTPGWLVWSWWILADVPGAVAGLAAVTVVVYGTRGDRVQGWAFAAIPLALAATYLRFGAPLVVSVALAGVLVLRWSVVRRNLVRAAVLGAGTVGSMVAVLVVPAVTGATVSPVKANDAMNASFHFDRFQAFHDFAVQLPELFGFDAPWELGRTGTGALVARATLVMGTLFLLAVLVGWCVALYGAIRGDAAPVVVQGSAAPAADLCTTSETRRNALLAVLSIAVVSLVVLGVSLGHGEPRYLVPVVPWIVIGAAAGFARVTPRIPRWAYVPIWLVLAVPAVFLVAELPPKADHFFTAYRDMGERVRDERPDCVLVGNVSRPNVGLPGRCLMRRIPERPDGSADLEQLRAELADVPRDHLAFVLDLADENLFAGERATTVDLAALTSTYHLREIHFDTEHQTGLRLFFAG